MGRLLTIGVGVFATVLGLLFVSLSFATDHWIEYVVQRDDSDFIKAVIDDGKNASYVSNPIYFNRNRGLLRTCYPGTESAWIDDAQYNSRRVDGICLWENGYELTQNPATVNYGSDYNTRKHLMRAHVGLQVVALVAILISIGLCVMACWKMSDTTLRYTGLACFLSALFMAGGMACFHGYDYLEREKIDQPEFRRHWERNPPLEGYAGASYGYSYISAWVGAGAQLIATVMFLVAANAIQRERDEERYEKDSIIDDRPMRAYDYMDPGIPAPYPPSYDYPTMHGPSDFPMSIPYDYAGSAAYGSERVVPVPAIEYAPSGLGYGY